MPGSDGVSGCQKTGTRLGTVFEPGESVAFIEKASSPREFLPEGSVKTGSRAFPFSSIMTLI